MITYVHILSAAPFISYLSIQHYEPWAANGVVKYDTDQMLSSRTEIELQFHPDPARQLSTNLYDIYPCRVYSEWTPDDGQTNCPKYIEFHAKINLRI